MSFITFEAYDVVVSSSLEGLVHGVNEFFQKGYRTVGGPFMVEREVEEEGGVTTREFHAQAVCKLAPPPEMPQVYTGE